MTAESLAGLARELRTNTTLTHLEVTDAEEDPPLANRPNPFRPIEEVLEADNFTLQEADWFQGSDASREAIGRLLRRNRWIKSALDALRRPIVPRGTPGRQHLQQQQRQIQLQVRLAPRVLAALGRFPTVLYRFLRRGEDDDDGSSSSSSSSSHHGLDPLELQQLRLLVGPRALAAAGSLPTLLYRYLLRGDANDWSRLVQPRQGPSSKKRDSPTTGPTV
jgi:hypothetical protein